jgi:hypothetical protein
MKPREVMICVLSGCVLVVFGLVPGLFQRLEEGIRNFHDQVSSGFAVSPPRYTEYDKLRRPIWLAGLGALLIVVGVLAYVSD